MLNVFFIADRKEDRIKVTRNTTRQGGKYYGLEENSIVSKMPRKQMKSH